MPQKSKRFRALVQKGFRTLVLKVEGFGLKSLGYLLKGDYNPKPLPLNPEY